LACEHKVYTTLCSDPRLRELLGWQLEFSGVGTGGVRFSVKGVRASGDFNTGLGNTLIMCCLVLLVARSIGTGFDFLADGDNAVVFVEKQYLDTWRRELPIVFLSAGHEAEVGPTAESLEEVCFGQSKPIFAGGVWRMVRDPFKVLSHACTGYRHYADMRGGLRVLKSVAYCEAVLSRGVPVLQAFSQSLLAATERVSFSKAELDNYEYARILSKGIHWASAAKTTITAESRRLFWRSWGVAPDEQVKLERQLSVVPAFPRDWSGVPIQEEMPDGRDYWTLPATTLHSERPGF